MDESPAKMYALASIMSVVAIVSVGLRFYVRQAQKQKLGADDWLMLPALVGTLGTAIAIYIATAEGGLGLHTPIEPDGAPDYTQSTVLFLQANFATLFTQILTFGCTKLSVLIFYRRLFKGKIFSVVSISLIVVTVLWSIGYFFANLFQCLPISANWAGDGSGSSACLDELKLYISESWSDMIIDALIISTPLPILWTLHLTARRKIALSGVFLLGAVTVLTSMARLIIYYDIQNTANSSGAADITWVIAPTFYWPLIESSLGILGACLPSLRPIFKGFSPESVIRSIRSALSLESLGSRRSKTGSGHSIAKKNSRGIAADNGSDAHIALTNIESGNEMKRKLSLQAEKEPAQESHSGNRDGIMVERSYAVV